MIPGSPGNINTFPKNNVITSEIWLTNSFKITESSCCIREINLVKFVKANANGISCTKLWMFLMMYCLIMGVLIRIRVDQGIRLQSFK
jgi:hypothetical protein